MPSALAGNTWTAPPGPITWARDRLAAAARAAGPWLGLGPPGQLEQRLREHLQVCRALSLRLDPANLAHPINSATIVNHQALLSTHRFNVSSSLSPSLSFTLSCARQLDISLEPEGPAVVCELTPGALAFLRRCAEPSLLPPYLGLSLS